MTSVGGADSGSASHSPGSGTGGAITFTDGGAASGGTFTYVATDGSAAVGPSATVEVVNITGTTLIGRSGALRDIIIGGGTADFIDGLDGNDVLVGNGGNDTLNGGAGQDVMDGGAGFDTYAFDDGHSGSNAANADVIAGFVSGTDKIGLAAIDAITQAGNKGDQDFLWGGENSNVVANSVTWWKDTATGAALDAESS